MRSVMIWRLCKQPAHMSEKSMNVLRLRSEFGMSALVFALWATACGSSGNGDGAAAPGTSTNANEPGNGTSPGATGAAGATGASGANTESGAGNVPLAGSAANGSNMSAGTSAPVNPVTGGSVPCG